MMLMLMNETNLWKNTPVFSPLFTLTRKTPIGMTTHTTDNLYYVKLYISENRDTDPLVPEKAGIIGMVTIQGVGVGVWVF